MKTAVALFGISAFALTACGEDPGEVGAATPKYGSVSEKLNADAAKKAGEIAGGKKIGGSLTLLGSLGGEERDQFLAAYKPFEEATGISVKYEGTRDMLSVLQTRVQGGNPPDVVSNPSIGQMKSLAASGKLISLDDKLDMATVTSQFDEGLIDLGGHNGHLYGVFSTAAVKGLIYYNTAGYDGQKPPGNWDELASWTKQRAASGHTPWCIGLESGAASGWPATDWIEQFMLSKYGTEPYDRWAKGELAWTSPEVRGSFEAFGQIASDKSMVNGGPTGVLSANFLEAANPMFAEKPQCDLTLQADWLGRTLPAQVKDAEPGKNLDFFQFPAADPKNANLVETAGEMVGVFKDTPQTRAFIEYLTSPEAQSIIASTGLWIAPNKAVSQDSYPTDLGRKAAKIFSTAKSVRFDASDNMPQDINQAFWAATLEYVKNPSSLDAVLDRVESIRTAKK